MIAKKHRLKRNEISYTQKKGLQTTSRFFIVRFSKNLEIFYKYCVIISRKIDNKATVRNKLKRQIFEIIRTSNTENIKKGLNIILIPKKEILNQSFNDIQKDINELLLKLSQKKWES